MAGVVTYDTDLSKSKIKVTNQSTLCPGKLTLVLLLLEAAFIILFGFFVRYDAVASPNPIISNIHASDILKTSNTSGDHGVQGQGQAQGLLNGGPLEMTTAVEEGQQQGGHGDVLSPKQLAEAKKNHIPDFYAMFQDIHVMMFIGFGFLMTFLKRYGFGSVGFNFLLAAFILQWATLTHGFIREINSESHTIYVDIVTLINSDFASAAVLISFGAVLGKVSMLQLIVMALFEIVVYQVNELIVFDRLHATDTGDSLVVHIFGAYFGLAVARVLYHSDIKKNEEKESSVYHSDIFAMIGTIFLWLFWPSFNGATAVDEGRVRAVINTYFSLTASTIVTYAVSKLVTKEKFSMVHIQNSTLAGGVAVGTVADMIIQPWGAMLVGGVAGTLSVLGYSYITPVLNKKLKIHDTCGVNNLHGMPGIMSGFAGILAAGIATPELYGDGLTKIFQGKQTLGHQAGIQAAALFVSLAMGLLGGTITGFILKIPIWDQPTGDQIFDDEDFWLIEDGFPEAHEHHEIQEKPHLPKEHYHHMEMKPHPDEKHHETNNNHPLPVKDSTAALTELNEES